MQREIDDQLATALLSGEIRDGDTVLVKLRGDGLAVAKADETVPPHTEIEPVEAAE